MSNLEDVLDDAYREWRGAPDDADLPDLQADAVRAWLAEVAQRDEVVEAVALSMIGLSADRLRKLNQRTQDAILSDALFALAAFLGAVGAGDGDEQR